MAALINSGIYAELSQTQYVFQNLTDSGDHIKYTLANKPWSRKSGYDYVVGGYGVVSGFAITPSAAASNNTVDIAAGELFAPGMTGANAFTGKITIAAQTSVTLTRGSTNGYKYNALTGDATGAGAVVAGTEGASFSATYGAAGGPPLIPVGSVLLGYVKYTLTAAAVVLASEIDQTIGTAQEYYTYPALTVDSIAGTITADSALQLNHTGSVTKRISAKVATPNFALLEFASNWKPAKNQATLNSTQYYRKTRGAATLALQSASFDFSCDDGLTDLFIASMKDNPTLLFKYSPDINKLPYSITQGIPSYTMTNTAGAHPTATITIAAAQETTDFAS